jgi:ribosomal protein S6
MQAYELTYIISPEVTTQEAEDKAKEIQDAIQKHEGVIVKQQNPIAKTLSYQIKKHASGFFGIIEFQIESEGLLEVKSMVQKDKKIVRHMVLIKKPVKIKKQRRSKKDALESLPSIEAKPSLIEKLGFGKKAEEKVEEPAVHEKVEKPKVELEDIDKQLDEILGE